MGDSAQIGRPEFKLRGKCPFPKGFCTKQKQAGQNLVLGSFSVPPDLPGAGTSDYDAGSHFTKRNGSTAAQTDAAASGFSPERASRFRWVICALLFFACVVNYMDRQVLGLLKPDLSKTFGWSETEYAQMAIFFQLAYAVGQIGVRLVHELDRRKNRLRLSVLFWSLSAMSHALCRTVGGFRASGWRWAWANRAIFRPPSAS